MSLPDFALVRPSSLEAAVEALIRFGPEAQLVAGGTDLFPSMKQGLFAPRVLVDLKSVPALDVLRFDRDEGLAIGAMTKISHLAVSRDVARSFPVLAEAARGVASPLLRNMGTVGGNLCLDTRCIYYNQSQWWRRANAFCLKHRGEICHVAPQGKRCHAAFCGDLAPALIALGGEVEIAGPGGRRRIGLGELYVEDGKAHLTLAVDELVVAVHVPADAPPSSYRKVRTREAIDFPLAGVAVALEVAAGTLKKLRIAVTGTNSRPFLVEGTHALVGKRIDETLLQALDKLVQKQVQPMRTTIASAHYRRLAAAALARRLVAKLAAEQAPAP